VSVTALDALRSQAATTGFTRFERRAAIAAVRTAIGCSKAVAATRLAELALAGHIGVHAGEVRLVDAD
jgi:hypothetical protein